MGSQRVGHDLTTEQQTWRQRLEFKIMRGKTQGSISVLNLSELFQLPALCCCCSVSQSCLTLQPHELLCASFPFPSISPAAAAAAKSLQSCPTLCDPIDGSSPGSLVPGILQARTLEWVAISFSNA